MDVSVFFFFSRLWPPSISKTRVNLKLLLILSGVLLVGVVWCVIFNPLSATNITWVVHVMPKKYNFFLKLERLVFALLNI